MNRQILLEKLIALLYHANERQIRLIYLFAVSIMENH